MMKIFSYIMVILVILLGVTFAMMNTSPVTLNYYVGTSDISLSLLLVLVLFIGVLLGVIFMSSKLLKEKYENRRYKNKLEQVQKQSNLS